MDDKALKKVEDAVWTSKLDQIERLSHFLKFNYIKAWILFKPFLCLYL